jgi:hypothetical protein
MAGLGTRAKSGRISRSYTSLWRSLLALLLVAASAAPAWAESGPPPIEKARGGLPSTPGEFGDAGAAKAQGTYTAPGALLLPDLQTLPPSDFDIRLLGGNRRVLRLANTVWNSGTGPLELLGRFNSETGQTAVDQRLFAVNGTETLEPVGEFVFHLGHDHFHIEGFARYDLWHLTEGGTPAWIAATSAKLSYCVIDTDAIDPDNPAFENRRRYLGCGRTRQGMSPGWGDEYNRYLEGQSLDITGLPDGLYALVSTANPDRRLIEADYTNNSTTVYLRIVGNTVTPAPAPETAREPCRVAGWC